MNKLNDALGSLARQLQERHSDDAETTITLTVERAMALFEAITAPQPQREWVGLTDEERLQFLNEILHYGTGFVAPLDFLARAIEAKLREKSGGGV